VILAGTFIAKQWVAPNLACKLACVAEWRWDRGWFLVLSWAVSLGHKRFSERGLLRLEHYSGVFLLGIALIHRVQIIWQLSKDRFVTEPQGGETEGTLRQPERVFVTC